MPKTPNTKKLKSFRLSIQTLANLADLAKKRGASEAEVLTILIDRAKREESKMQYKGFSIETFLTIGGFGWSATSEDYGAMGKPNASQNDHTTYSDESAARANGRKGGRPKMKTFQLNIYTYNAMEGANPQVRSSMHDTPEEAVAHLDTQAQSYAYAVLSKRNQHGYAPCDWKGDFVHVEVWPKRKGANGSHPDVVALRAAWDNLIEETRQRWNDSDFSMVEVASNVLRERFPSVTGYSERLALATHDAMKKQ